MSSSESERESENENEESDDDTENFQYGSNTIAFEPERSEEEIQEILSQRFSQNESESPIHIMDFWLAWKRCAKDCSILHRAEN